MLDSVAYPAPNVPCPNPGSEGLSGPARLRKVIHVDMDAFCASVEPRQPGAQGQARRGRGSASSWPSPAPRPVAAASDRPCPPSRLWADGRRAVYPPRPPSSTSATGSAPPPVYSDVGRHQFPRLGSTALCADGQSTCTPNPGP
jgi:hypothetical protein